jgi:hypothetical protein
VAAPDNTAEARGAVPGVWISGRPGAALAFKLDLASVEETARKLGFAVLIVIAPLFGMGPAPRPCLELSVGVWSRLKRRFVTRAWAAA